MVISGKNEILLTKLAQSMNCSVDELITVLIEHYQDQQTITKEVRHDLRSVVNPILGFSKLLLEDEHLTEEQYENSRLIYDSAEQLLHIIHRLNHDGVEHKIEAKLFSSLTVKDLEIMPKEWCNQLLQAALIADKQQVLTLIKTIPTTEHHLINHLTLLAQRFQFEQILYLINSLYNDG